MARTSRPTNGTAVSTAQPAAVVSDLVASIAESLESAGIGDAPSEARDMVAIAVGEARLWPHLHRDALLDAATVERARSAARSRGSGAPFAYAVGRAPFRHLTLSVDERVLIPRQETELLVDLVLPFVTSGSCMRIADIGTGSGAIALALASEATESVELVIATDVSRDALDIAMLNSSMLPALAARKIEFRCGDMFSVIPECNLDAVVCNPPYIAFDEAVDLPASVRNWEPPTALFSAQQGMLETARLISGSAAALGMGGLLAIEVDSRRASLVAELVLSHASFRDVRVEPDLTGRERFVLAKREK